MERKVTANRPKLNNARRIRRDHNNFVYVDGVKVAQYVPALEVLRFVDRSRPAHDPGRMVEVSLSELLDGLSRISG